MSRRIRKIIAHVHTMNQFDAHGFSIEVLRLYKLLHEQMVPICYKLWRGRTWFNKRGEMAILQFELIYNTLFKNIFVQNRKVVQDSLGIA